MIMDTQPLENAESPTLYLVGLEERLTQFLSSMKIRTEYFSSPEDFLPALSSVRPGCIVCDVVVTAGISGFQLLRLVSERNPDLPVVLVSAVADMSLALRAVSEGALTLLASSCDAEQAWDAVNRGLQVNHERRTFGATRRRLLSLIERLSERETQVLRRVTEGHANKQIAAEMNVSLRSVEKWRKDGLEKLLMDSPLQLLRMLMQSGFRDWPNNGSQHS